jgi:hypothetical protein
MANGEFCAHCGHTEGAHDELREALGLESDEALPDVIEDAGDVTIVLNDIDSSRDILRGYSATLLTCRGFVSEGL